MSDVSLRELERAWEADPGNQELLTRLTGVRRRQGLPVAWLRDWQIVPGRVVRNRGAECLLNVGVEQVDGRCPLHYVQPGAALDLPRHRHAFLVVASWETADENLDCVEEELDGIHLQGCGDETLELVCQRVPRLTWLRLDLCNVSNAGLDSLADRPLACLFIERSSNITRKGLARLRRFRLSRLALERCQRIGDEAAHSLADQEHLAALSLRGCPLQGNGIARLQDLPRLRTLDIGASRKLRDLSFLSGFKRLRALGLARLALGDDDLDPVLDLSQLTALDLGENRRLTANGLERLQALPRLRSLVVPGKNLNDHGLWACMYMRGLERLVIESTFERRDLRWGSSLLSDRVIEKLPIYTKLKHLEFRFCLREVTFSPDALTALGRMEHLETLHLGEITSAVLDSLYGLTNLKALSFLDCEQVSSRAEASFREALPDCRLTRVHGHWRDESRPLRYLAAGPVPF